MKDSDNALLLKPIELGEPYPALDAPRPPIGATEVPTSIVPVLTDTGAVLAATFETLVAANNFPALPLRDETVLAWFATFPSDSAYDEHRRRLEASQVWQRKVLPELVCRSVAPPQQLRLRPTARS